MRAPATALYAFCRRADDADRPRRRCRCRDGSGCSSGWTPSTPARRKTSTATWRWPPSCTATRIPRALLDALLEGFLWDAQGRRYDTLDALQDYGARVAGTVGAMMALVMGTRDRQALARACELGVAMQLTNIARDVGEDARNGRLYLPRRWLADAKVDVTAWLQAPCFDDAVAQVVGQLLDAADVLYDRAEHGIAALPRDCRPAIRAARLVYAEIGAQLRRNGLDSVNRRTVVPRQRKVALMARASAAALSTPGNAATTLAPLPAVAGLVETAAAAPQIAPMPGRVPTRSLDERVAWMLELFERQATQRALR